MPQKLEDIFQAIKDKNPTWTDAKCWAVAQAQYKDWKRKHG